MIPRIEPYIWDALYGPIRLPEFIWDIISTPELQRLREVRLCNINSFCLTGGANINRYEHAIGTCYLAIRCSDSWPALAKVSESEYRNFLLAALLHDIASAAFGHSVEYIESRVGFDHESAFSHVVLGQIEKGSYEYKSTTFEPIFFGMARNLFTKISSADLLDIGEIVTGKGRLGPLISSTLDLDNIDNVFRLAYHIGITRSGHIGLRLAESMRMEEDEVILKKESIPLVEEWQGVRRRLYKLLLLNPQEFAGKCMLTEAIELAKLRHSHSFKWYDVDFELLKELAEVSSESNLIISRLMRGDLYGCLGIFSSSRMGMRNIFDDQGKRTKLEGLISGRIREKFPSRFKSALVAIHCIVDSNKTDRQVKIRTDTGEVLIIGRRSDELLIGVFLKNTGMNMYQINRVPEIKELRREALTLLAQELGDNSMKEMEQYAEANECRQ
jgi:HD superfamily phosphohydrolase